MFGDNLEAQYAARVARASLSASVLCNACIAALWGIQGLLEADHLQNALDEHGPR